MAHQFPVKAVASTWYQPYVHTGAPNKPVVNLRSYFGQIRDQLQLGSCSAFAATNHRTGTLVQQGKPLEVFSALANYYQERVINGTVNTDSGATMQEAVQVLEEFGVMPDSVWDYTNYLQKFTQAPPSNAWLKDLHYDPANVFEIQQATVLEDTLDALNNGWPVLFGFTVFPDLESSIVADNGYLPMPIIPPGQSIDWGNIGGHMVVAIGKNDETQQVLCLNQWGASWGIKSPATLAGCFYMPYAYFKTYAFNPVVYKVTTAVQVSTNYSMTVKPSATSVEHGKLATITVSTNSDRGPVGSQALIVTTVNQTTHTVSRVTYSSSTNGESIISINTSAIGKLMLSVDWIDPEGVSHLESVTIDVIASAPIVHPVVNPIVEYSVKLHQDAVAELIAFAKSRNWEVTKI